MVETTVAMLQGATMPDYHPSVLATPSRPFYLGISGTVVLYARLKLIEQYRLVMWATLGTEYLFIYYICPAMKPV